MSQPEFKLDILAFGAHPDDVELGCGGTLIKHVESGKKVGIVDLTRGELGTRGTPAIRQEEARRAAEIIGAAVRENLGFADGFFTNDREHQLEVIRIIRKYQPHVVITNAPHDRHPDHRRAAKLIRDAAFLAGLAKIETFDNGKKQSRWRPPVLLYYIQAIRLKPDIIIDISPYWERKMESVRAHRSQFYDPESTEPETFISSPAFLESVEARAKDMGRLNGADYAEGFICHYPYAIEDLTTLK